MRFLLIILSLLLLSTIASAQKADREDYELKGKVRTLVEESIGSDPDVTSNYNYHLKLVTFNKDGQVAELYDSSATLYTYIPMRQHERSHDIVTYKVKLLIYKYDSEGKLYKVVADRANQNSGINVFSSRLNENAALQRGSERYKTELSRRGNDVQPYRPHMHAQWWNDFEKETFRFRICYDNKNFPSDIIESMLSGHEKYLTQMHYDTLGRLFEKTKYLLRERDSAVVESWRYHYNKKGRLVQESVYTPRIPQYRPAEIYSYNKRGLIIERTVYDEGHFQSNSTFTHDMNGRVVGITVEENKLPGYQVMISYPRSDLSGNYLRSVKTYSNRSEKLITTRKIEYYK